MNYIFNGSIIDCVWQDGLDRLLLYWLTGRLLAPMSAYPFDHFAPDMFHTNFPCRRPILTMASHFPYLAWSVSRRGHGNVSKPFMSREASAESKSGLAGSVRTLFRTEDAEKATELGYG